MTAINLPDLPNGPGWRENPYGIPSLEANIVRLADGSIMDCTDAVDILRWRRIGDDTDITHWSRVLSPELYVTE